MTNGLLVECIDKDYFDNLCAEMDLIEEEYYEDFCSSREFEDNYRCGPIEEVEEIEEDLVECICGEMFDSELGGDICDDCYDKVDECYEKVLSGVELEDIKGLYHIKKWLKENRL